MKRKAPIPPLSLVQAARNVMAAMAIVETLRPKILNIQEELLLKAGIKYHDAGDKTGFVILKADDLYLASPEDEPIVQQFYNDLDEAYKQAGYNDLEHGQCPLLMAENTLRQARQLLAKETAAFIPVKISYETLMATSTENYNKYIDLTLRWLGPYVAKLGTSKEILDMIGRIKN